MKVIRCFVTLIVLIFLLSDAALALFCTDCGAKNPDRAKFCFKCGTKTVKGAAAAKPQSATESSAPGLPKGYGAVVVYLVKNYPDRGGVPGFLELKTGSRDKLVLLDKVPRIGYDKGGQVMSYASYNQSVPVTSHLNSTTFGPNGTTWNTYGSITSYVNVNRVIPYTEDVTRATYFHVQIVPAGKHFFSVEKEFKTTEIDREDRHKYFQDVVVPSGKYILLDYYWEVNQDFGKECAKPSWYHESVNSIRRNFDIH